MGVQLRITAAAVALTLLAQAASAQDEPQGNKVILPPIDVSSSRLGGGITGSSTTIISSEDLQRVPESTAAKPASRPPAFTAASTAPERPSTCAGSESRRRRTSWCW